MDYLYENLGDERFQQFCHSLLSYEFPNTQAFPVGQPDGGRDSLSYTVTPGGANFIVFQVKFVRNPQSISDPHKWLIEQLEQEAPKINKLIPKGASSYYLLTNVKSTAHLDVGSIDIVAAILKKHISIPSMCWWRDDLSRLIEKYPPFLWSYPQIMHGQDVLNALLFGQLTEHRDRRQNTITAYLADQYNIDNEVKFKQIDLQNRLFDLFTDVPIRIKKWNDKDKSLQKALRHFAGRQRNPIHPDAALGSENDESVGAAHFLLHPTVQNKISRILLEGGPGQGKSTISQYISQVHRARLLNKEYDLAAVPSTILTTPVRLPIKIDLRHIAAWVENRNPYEGVLNDIYFSSIYRNSLEAFLVAHVAFHSQIQEFTTTDLLAVFKSSAVLLVFDGFDEIGSPSARKDVIEFINKGINRLSENSISLQVIVTSRPSVFSDSVGFSTDIYPHFELTDVTPALTKEYVGKWIKANKLDYKEAAEINRLVSEKLEMPHLRDLAKSPMQLAIFISLLRTKGESLPNKRTALYDSYVSLLFDRESEKSTIIRDHRDLIIDIHQYLGWILHSEAELLKNGGSIRVDDLKELLKKYLEIEEHPTDIADKLFDVVKDRVCALASRIQGTFEFEVQPLREYFCAKFLYITAPHSPAGDERSGTKPDRFEAIARNNYWQNVVRFYAGCFGKGELPMLIMKLKELQQDPLWRFTNYPRLLTAQILSDWVFTQYPVLMKDVVKLVVQDIHQVSGQSRTTSNLRGDVVELPPECGRQVLFETCFTCLTQFPPNDYAAELAAIIRANPMKTLERWLDVLGRLPSDRITIWIRYAAWLGILGLINEDELVSRVNGTDDVQTWKRIQILVDGGRMTTIQNNMPLKQKAKLGVLAKRLVAFDEFDKNSSLQCLTYVLDTYVLATILTGSDSPVSFVQYISRYYSHGNPKAAGLVSKFSMNDIVDDEIHRFMVESELAMEADLTTWRSSLVPWDILAESARSIWGNVWVLTIFSCLAAGIKSKSETYEEFGELGNAGLSLCKRVRCARLKSGNTKYWQEQLADNREMPLKLLVILSWGSPLTLATLANTLDKCISKLSKREYGDLAVGLRQISKISFLTKKQQSMFSSSSGLKMSSERLKYLFRCRFSEDSLRHVYGKQKPLEKDVPSIVGRMRLRFLVDRFAESPGNERWLEAVKECYKQVQNYDGQAYLHRIREYEGVKVPHSIAKRIMEHTADYPRVIGALAERSCRIYANTRQKPVGEVAREDRWFV